MVGFNIMKSKNQYILRVLDTELRAIHFAMLLNSCYKYETEKVGRTKRSSFYFFVNEDYLEAKRLVDGDRML